MQDDMDIDEANIPGPSGLSGRTSASDDVTSNGVVKPSPSETMLLSQATSQAFDSREQYDATTLIEEIDEELQKEQQGICKEDALRNLLIKLEFSKVNEKTGRGCKVDSLAFKKFSQLMVSKASQLKDDKEKFLNINEIAENLRDFAEDAFDYDDPNRNFNAFTVIGEKISYLLSKAPPFSYIKPCIPFMENLKIKEKKERIRSQRNVGETKVVQGQTAEQAKRDGECTNESSVTRELDNVRRHFRVACKQSMQNGHGGDGTSVDYFRFVLHPTSFGESVENMFYVSFLIRDGHVRLRIDESTGSTTIERLSREEREELSVADRSALDTSQFVSRIDYILWQKLVKRLKIIKPMITR